MWIPVNKTIPEVGDHVFLQETDGFTWDFIQITKGIPLPVVRVGASTGVGASRRDDTLVYARCPDGRSHTFYNRRLQVCVEVKEE